MQVGKGGRVNVIEVTESGFRIDAEYAQSIAAAAVAAIDLRVSMANVTDSVFTLGDVYQDLEKWLISPNHALVVIYQGNSGPIGAVLVGNHPSVDIHRVCGAPNTIENFVVLGRLTEAPTWWIVDLSK